MCDVLFGFRFKFPKSSSKDLSVLTGVAFEYKDSSDLVIQENIHKSGCHIATDHLAQVLLQTEINFVLLAGWCI